MANLHSSQCGGPPVEGNEECSSDKYRKQTGIVEGIEKFLLECKIEPDSTTTKTVFFFLFGVWAINKKIKLFSVDIEIRK